MRKITSIVVYQEKNGLQFLVRHEDGKHDKVFSSTMNELEWNAMQKLLKTMVPEVETDSEALVVYYYPR